MPASVMNQRIMSRALTPAIESFMVHAAVFAAGAILLNSSPNVLKNPFGSMAETGSLTFIALEASAPVPAPRRAAPPVTEGLAVAKKKPVPVGETAPAVSGAASTATTPGTTDGDRQAGIKERYVYGLRQLIDRKKNYPALSRRMGETGQVLVRVKLARDGTLSDLTIRERSGFSRLDQAAFETVSAIGKYEPIPEAIAEAPLVIDIPIEFTL